MELIVAVYDDWGIGKDGTQPIALSADRKFFRETTRGCMVIVGRRTIADFPDQKPLPGRVNVALTRTCQEIPGFTVCTSPAEAAELAKTADRAMIIGGGSIYKQMLPMCDTAYVTKVHCTPESDTLRAIPIPILYGMISAKTAFAKANFLSPAFLPLMENFITSLLVYIRPAGTL